MKSKEKPVRCYIAAFNNASMDPFLESRGFSRGMVCFAIPSFGILFRCRTEGTLLDLEFSALFSLLEFVNTKLEDEKIKSVQIFSSNPELVFSFTEKSPHMKPGSVRRTLLDQYARKTKIAVGYIKPVDNRALVSSAEYPSLPDGQKLSFSYDASELRKTEFKPFQKGIKI